MSRCMFVPSFPRVCAVCSVWPPPWVYLWPRHQLADYKIHLNIDYLDIFSEIFNFYIFFQENKCLLGIYFLVVLALLIGTVYKISFCWFYELKLFQLCILWLTKKRPGLLGVIIFGILVYKGDLFDRLETPLYKSLNMYEDNPAGNEAEKTKKEAFKQIWNTVQQDVLKNYKLTELLWLNIKTFIRWNVAAFSMLTTGGRMSLTRTGRPRHLTSLSDAAIGRKTTK